MTDDPPLYRPSALTYLIGPWLWGDKVNRAFQAYERQSRGDISRHANGEAAPAEAEYQKE